MWVLVKIGSNPKPLMEVFGIDFPEPTPKNAERRTRHMPAPFIVGGVLLLASAVSASFIGDREEIIPQRKVFTEFPRQIGEWQGKSRAMEQIYIDTLKFDDYIIQDYVDESGQRLEFYVAYYGSQQKGESAHSPRSCLPGGGWKIDSLKDYSIPLDDGRNLVVNRVLIRQGEYAQLVYYWFMQRGRDITNEYLVKWYLFWDALTRSRTDGALIRVTANVKPGESLAAVDQRLTRFTAEAADSLQDYVPD